MTETETVAAIAHAIKIAAKAQGISQEIETPWILDGAVKVTRNVDEFEVIISADDGKVTFSSGTTTRTVPLGDSDFYEVVEEVLKGFGFPFTAPA